MNKLPTKSGLMAMVLLALSLTQAQSSDVTNDQDPCVVLGKQMGRLNCVDMLMGGPQPSGACRRKVYSMCIQGCTYTVPDEDACVKMAESTRCDMLSRRWHKRNCSMKDGEPKKGCRNLKAKFDLEGCTLKEADQRIAKPSF